MNYTDKQIEDLISGVYAGNITVDNLPEDLYLAIGNHLEDGIREGWGSLMENIPLGTPDVPLYNALRENVYIFSAAKTYQEIREMAEFIAESTSYTNFKVKAMATYGEYNTDWLKAEYNTAVGQAQQANQWKRIQENKETFPTLRYSAVIDSKTSEICRPLDGVTLPVDDPFWNNYAPLNHFNCRCTFEKLDKYEDATITRKGKIDELNKELGETVKPEFRMNSGKDGYIFDPKSHPYFKVAPKDKPLAKENFNLPIPPPIEPKVAPIKTDDDIEARIKKVKEASKELHETGIGKTYKEAKKAVKDADAEVSAFYKEGMALSNTKGFYDPETVEARKKVQDSIDKRALLIKERDALRFPYEDKVTEILKSRNAPSKFKLIATPAQLSKKGIERLKDGSEAFKSIIGDKLLGENTSIGVNTLRKGGRAFFTGSDNAISITKAEDIGTITHELGHGLEYHNKSYFDKVKNYYEKRTKGEPLQMLSKVTGNRNYGAREITKEDKFREPYVGKWYANASGQQRATELTSMWFTEAYEDLERFIETDNDYFEHFYKLFNE
jgi:SPP1 gp7 family putative phage head morphogenesis protein